MMFCLTSADIHVMPFWCHLSSAYFSYQLHLSLFGKKVLTFQKNEANYNWKKIISLNPLMLFTSYHCKKLIMSFS